jgi:hypothetical protein
MVRLFVAANVYLTEQQPATLTDKKRRFQLNTRLNTVLVVSFLGIKLNI